MKPIVTKYLFLILLLLASSKQLLAQCPSVLAPQQSFCDVQTPTVASLIAVNNGGGIVWYNSPTSTTPLPPNAPLASGATYYAGDTANLCENRPSVAVTIYGTPNGLNFQGVCVENLADATLTDLIVIGNNIKWYLTPIGGTPLPPNSQLVNNTVYFASQTNPDTGCETSRLAVFVNVRVVTAPTGESVQNFCYDPLTEAVTVSDLIVDVPLANWYLEEDAIVPLAVNTPLIDGHTYYATTVSYPCESIGRFPVTVHLFEKNKAGNSSNQTFCQPDLTSQNSIVNLFSFLGGNPHQTGFWQGDTNISNGYLGTIDLSDLALDTPYIFTYTVDTTVECEPSQAQVQIEIKSFIHAGVSNQLEICNTDTSTYDLFELLGPTAEAGGFWTPQLASGTNIFNPQVDAIGVYAYSFANSCSDSATVTISNMPILSAGQNNSVDICPTDTTTYDLFTFLGGNPDQGGIWTPPLASGTNIFNPQVDAPGVYTYSFDDGCNLDSATITIVPIPVLNAGENNTLVLCQNDTNTYNLFALLGENANTGGNWTPQLASGTNIFNPQVDPAGVYTYSFNDNCSTDTATINIIFAPAYNAGQNNYVEICPNDTNTHDLFTLLGGNPDQGGVWTPQLASGTSIFNPQIDPAGVYTYSFEDCPSSASVTIAFTPILNPGQSNSLEICPEVISVYDLFAFLGPNVDLGGVWTPALASGTGIFDSQVDPIGTYTYSFSDGCNTAVSTITISYLPVFNPGESNSLEICPNDTNTYNLFSLLGGTPDQGGSWTPPLASGTNIFNPQLDPIGIYTYSFENDCSDSASITIFYTPDSNAGEDAVLEICHTDTHTYDLFALLGGNPDQGGVWIPSLASGTSVFNPQLDAAGVYTYAFENECSDSSTVTISIIAELNAGEDNSLDICENDTNNHDLFPLLGPNANQGGIWTPSLASGTSIYNPLVDTSTAYTYSFADDCNLGSATINIYFLPILNTGESTTLEICPNDTTTYDLFELLGGNPDQGGFWAPALTSGSSIFDPQIDPIGVYTYNFIDNCNITPTSVTISYLPFSNPGEDSTLEICENDTNTYNLFDLLEGNPTPGGTWTPQLASGTHIFNPQIDTIGIYTYSFTDDCNTASASITISSAPSLNAGEDNTLQICPNETNMYDLFTLLGANADQGGSWTPSLASGTSIFNPQLDAAGIYTYSFNDVCADSATITISVVPVMNAGENNTLQVCENDTNTHDLFSLLGANANPGGVWTPSLASGTNIFNPQVDPIGVYTYLFTDGCNTDTSTITITYIPSQNAGEDNELWLCQIETNTYDLFVLLGGNPDQGGIWTPELASGTSIFDPQLDAFGVYTYSFVNACSDSATISVLPLPELSAGDDNSLEICHTETETYDLFATLLGNPNPGGIWTPALASGTNIFDPQVDAVGVYTYSFNDNCNTDTATITITNLPSYYAGESNVIEICPDDTNFYDMFTFLGGNADQGGIWTPPLTSGGGIFNQQLDAIGVYTYAFAEACSSAATITIVLLPELNAGEDNTLEICPDDTTTYDLFTLLGGTPDAGGIWTPPLASGTGIFDPQVDPVGFYSYAFANPCSNSATIAISLLPSFNPGDDNTLDICSDDTNTYDLFSLLGENAELGGIWTPELTSGTSIFDPLLDLAGTYTYSFTNTCSGSAAITISLIPDLNAGEDNTLEICDNDTNSYDLFSLLGGIPDTGGIWTPSLASGTNTFNPQLDVAGSYTYAFQDGCNLGSATITIERTNCIPPVDELLIPDGFSPNDDGINDFFEIRNIRTLYPNFKIEIYNRYGNLLFVGDRNTNDWDGTTHKGVKIGDGKAPAGVYFYILYFNDGQRGAKQGRLYLSR